MEVALDPTEGALLSVGGKVGELHDRGAAVTVELEDGRRDKVLVPGSEAAMDQLLFEGLADGYIGAGGVCDLLVAAMTLAVLRQGQLSAG